MAARVQGLSQIVQISAGVVNGDGSYSGNNFSAVRVGSGSGTTTIFFSPPFGVRPTVLVTQYYNAGAAGGDPRDNAVVVAVQPNQAIILTGDNAGKQQPRAFSFIALGPQGNQPITSQIGVYQGSVAANGTFVSSAPNAFSIQVDTSNSIYNISTTVPFTYVPACVAKQDSQGDTRDNAVITSMTQSKIGIKTGDNNGNKSARDFEFIFAGPVSGTPQRTIQQLIYGSLNTDGTIKSGYGFDAAVVNTGIRCIAAYTPFSTRPTVVVTQNYPGNDVLNPGVAGDSRDNAIEGPIDARQFQFRVGGSDGKYADRAAEFVALF